MPYRLYFTNGSIWNGIFAVNEKCFTIEVPNTKKSEVPSVKLFFQIIEVHVMVYESMKKEIISNRDIIYLIFIFQGPLPGTNRAGKPKFWLEIRSFRYFFVPVTPPIIQYYHHERAHLYT